MFYLFFGNFIYGNCKLWRAKCQSVSNRAFVLRATTRASKSLYHPMTNNHPLSLKSRDWCVVFLYACCQIHSDVMYLLTYTKVKFVWTSKNKKLYSLWCLHYNKFMDFQKIIGITFQIMQSWYSVRDIEQNISIGQTSYLTNPAF